jgi:hypothetical protein
MALPLKTPENAIIIHRKELQTPIQKRRIVEY